MASTFSPQLRIELIGAGEQSGAWNNTTNTNLGTLIEQAISGVAAINIGSSTSYTLETANGASDEARSMVLQVTGTPGAAFNVICPTSSKVYIVKNSVGTYTMTLKTSAGSGIAIPSGRTMLLYCDGTNVVSGVNELPTGSTVSGDVIATLTGTQTLTNKTLTSPKIGTAILDTGGNSLFNLTATGSAVNYMTVANAATAGSPSITAAGSDTNVDLLLAAKGSGVVKAGGVEIVTLTGTQSLSNKTIASPANVSATTGNAAIIAATGPDANIDINLTPKGSGSVLFGGTAPIFIPTGAVVPFAGTSAPTGWILTFGQAVSRTTYAALFAVIGTTYGSGDGSTTFNLPDLRGRVVAGEDDMGGTSANRLTGLSGGVDGDVLGGTGGLETHTLTVAQIPLHGHPAYISTSGTDPNSTGGFALNSESVSTYSAYTGSLSATPGQQIGGTGGGDSHNNVQPTIILNYIIKT